MLLVWLPIAQGLVVRGELPTTKNFAMFVDKFCYDYRANPSKGKEIAGLLELTVTGRTFLGGKADEIRTAENMVDHTAGKLLLMLFDDEDDRWKKARRSWDHSTCDEKARHANHVLVVDLSSEAKQTSTVKVNQHIRDRFWYFAFVNCGATIREVVRYKLHATNPHLGFQQEFGIDHLNLITIHVAFAAFFVGTALGNQFLVKKHHSQSYDSALLRLLRFAISSSAVSSLLLAAHYWAFKMNGAGDERVRFMAMLSAAVSRATLILIGLLIAKGWSISTTLLDDRHIVFGVLAAVVTLSALCELHHEFVKDETTALFLYSSAPGTIIVLVNMFCFCWMGKCLFETRDEEKLVVLKGFYKKIFVGYACWYLMIPLAVVLAHVVSPWVRYRCVILVELTARLGLLVFLSFELWPGKLPSRVTGAELTALHSGNGDVADTGAGIEDHLVTNGSED